MNRIGIIERTHKIIFCVALFVFFAGATLFAAPSISGVSGTVTNGQSITISGTGFGSGPNVVVFDNFEKGTNGNNIMTGTGSAQVGKWDVLTGTLKPKYSNSNPLSGNLCFRANMASDWLEYVSVNLPSGTTKVFFSWWMRTDQLPNASGSGENWKVMWLFGNDDATNDIDFIFVNGQQAISGNNTSYTGWFYLSDWSLNKWERCAEYIEEGTSGKVQFWELTSSGIATRLNSTASIYPSGQFASLHVNAYGKQTSSCNPQIDDVYVATGDNARARIEIGNNATYTSCTKLTICTPNSWTSNGISAKVWQGQFGSSDPAYLFVLDSSGNASPGYSIKFGSGSGGSADTTPPAAPSGVTAVIVP
jgi:hypothetical protein